MFEWYVVWCGSKNGYQKGHVFKRERGLSAQNVIPILDSIGGNQHK